MRLGPSTGLTDPGRKRRRNEDSFVVDPPLFVIADGMGGAQAGEVASRLAASAFREYHGADELEPEGRLAAIIQEANRRIYERSRSDAATSGMGTTITAALFQGAVSIGHVGDSRAYRLREGRLEQLTHDHSLVGDLVRSGRLTPEEARLHPQRSVITRALGTDPDVDVDTFTVEPEAGDVYLLCSDGLTDMLEDQEIVGLVRDGGGLESTAKALVKAANRKGGEDNVTVVLFAVESGEALEETARIDGNGRGEAEELEDTLSGLEATAPVAPPPPDPATVTQIGGPAGAPPPSASPVPTSTAAAETRAPASRLFAVIVALGFVALLVLAAWWALALLAGAPA